MGTDEDDDLSDQASLLEEDDLTELDEDPFEDSLMTFTFQLSTPFNSHQFSKIPHCIVCMCM